MTKSAKIGHRIALTLANTEKLTKINRNGLKMIRNGTYNELNMRINQS